MDHKPHHPASDDVWCDKEYVDHALLSFAELLFCDRQSLINFGRGFPVDLHK